MSMILQMVDPVMNHVDAGVITLLVPATDIKVLEYVTHGSNPKIIKIVDPAKCFMGIGYKKLLQMLR